MLPTAIGASIVVADSDELATLSLAGLTVGTQVWNIDVGAYFKLTQSERTDIDLETTDGYDTPTWTLANATFTGFEGCTLVLVLQAPNVAFSSAYVIDTVGSATEVDVVDPPDGATTGELFGSAVLYNDALVTDSVVNANGVTGLRWVIVTAATGTVESVTATTANGVDNSDAANPVIKDASAANAGLMSAAAFSGLPVDVAATGTLPGSTLSFGTLDGNNDGDYEIEYDLICGTNAPGSILLKVNTATTNTASSAVYNFGGAGATTLDPGLGIFNTNATTRIVGRVWLTSKAGHWRIFTNIVSDTGLDMITYAGAYKDTTTNITGLTIVAANANAFDAGSSARLRKLHKA